MGFFEIVSNIILISMLISLFNLLRYMFKIRKVMKMHKDNPNIKGISIVNGEVKVIESQSAEGAEADTTEWVEDAICGEKVEKKDAYRIVREGQEYFFSSWESREQFLNQ